MNDETWLVIGAVGLFLWFWHSLEGKLVRIIQILDGLDRRLHEIERRRAHDDEL